MNFHMVLPFVLARIEKDGKILLGKQPMSPKKAYPGYWDLPAGKIEATESVMECIKREVKEETGFDVVHAEIFDIYHHNETEFLEGYTSGIPGIAICFDVEFEGEFNPQEMDEMQWVEYERVKELRLAPWASYFLQDLIQK